MAASKRYRACAAALDQYVLRGHVFPEESTSQTYHAPFFFSSRRRHTRLQGDWSSDVCSSDLGYCNARTVNPLDGKPLEKQLELQAAGTNMGSIHGALEAPYFYTAPNVARVNLAMEIPPDSLKFEKEKGKYHANVNILGIAYKPDGSVGARFNDTVNLDLEKDEWKEFTKNP